MAPGVRFARPNRWLALASICFSVVSCSDTNAPVHPLMDDPTLPPSSRVVAIGTGFSSTCALVQDGHLYCWGENRFGEVGNGTTIAQPVPQQVIHDSLFSAVVGTQGTSRSCATTVGGTAYCWGYNLNGELGDGSTEDRSRPALVRGGIRFRDLATSYHTCGVAVDSVAYCWGLGLGGALGQGQGSQSNFSTPQRVATNLRFVAITTGMEFTCTLDTVGTAYCWGWAAMVGGPAAPGAASDTPVRVATTERFVRISAAEEHTCALTSDGSVYCWGKVRGLSDTVYSTPMRIPGLPPLRQVVGGRLQRCVLSTDRAAYCGFLADSLTAVADSIRFAGLSVGSANACGFTRGGAAFCWGAWDDTAVRVAIPTAGR